MKRFLLVIPFLSVACAGDVIENCTTDDDCAPGERCLTIVDDSTCSSADPTACACVREAGEGEGDGGGDECEELCVEECDTGPFAPGDGSFTLYDCTLDDDPGNTADCGTNASSYAIDCSLDGAIGGDCASAGGCSGDEESVGVDGAEPTFCSSFPFVVDGVLVCPYCFDAATFPTSLVVQFNDDGNGSSNPVCVDESTATPP